MPKKDPVADALARLAALRDASDPATFIAGLTASLKDKSAYVVARAANLAAERNARDTIPALVARLEQFVTDAKAHDPNCDATLALIKALIALEAGYEAEDVAMAASAHVRFEPVFGGSTDTAVATRGQAVILLAAMGSTQAVRRAVEVLAAPDARPPREQVNWPARADAARALTMTGQDAAAAVLRLKLLTGDPEANVLTDCLAGLLAIEGDHALPLARRMLAGPGSATAEAALLALGGWRDARGVRLLLDHADRFLVSDARDLFLATVAMTRQPAAIEYLLGLAQNAAPAQRDAAIAALEPLRFLPNVADRLARVRADQ